LHQGRAAVTVAATVPPGIKRVLLESRARLGSGNWAPVAVKNLDGAGGNVVFNLDCTENAALLRVRGDSVPPLPTAFYVGPSNFWGAASGVGRMYTDVLTLGGNTGPDSTVDAREVVESDIWKSSPDRLYFFNQYRGLQIIDISMPDEAVIKGTLAMAAAGEQMYLLGTNHVLLLARDGCWSSSEGSQALVVDVVKDTPSLLKRLPLPGHLQESRMVGTALYVATQSYRQLLNTTNNTWEWGTTVSAFDLADPTNPIPRNTLWYPGYGNVVYATDVCLFVATQDPDNGWQSRVQIIDITSPDGKMAAYGAVRPGGQIKDKFKLNYEGGILTTIAEDSRRANNSPFITRLETWTVPDPRSAGTGGISKLGELQLGRGERLHATRFDGDRVYVVTFFQTDPLWVVDLSDPARPIVSGELEVPGWSTYIHPLGAQLVSVGVESNRVAVSLFDVAKPSQPALLSRILLGESYSWTEANSDEKAFSVLESAGMILVPYGGYTTNGWASRVQIIDLLPHALAARGVIEHAFQPRRATFTHDRVVSLSGQELLSVDSSDRDLPVVRGSLALSWPVDTVLLQGAYLLQISTASGWSTDGNPSVRVAPAGAPSAVLAALELEEIPISGSCINGDRLYLAQNYAGYWMPAETNEVNNFFVTVIDLSELPKLKIIGKTSGRVELGGGSTSWTAHWPRPDTLVWTGGMDPYWGPWWSLGVGFMDFGIIRPWPGSGSPGGHLVGLDVSNPEQPRVVSDLNLTTNSWHGFSQVFREGSLLYVSHTELEAVEDPAQKITNWVQRSYLDVVDYADPMVPTVRRPVSIPGLLEGVSHAGEMLYTRGNHGSNTESDSREYIDASAYDGVAAHLVASLPLSDNWPRPVLVAGTNVIVGVAQYETGGHAATHHLDKWSVEKTGKFVLGASQKIEQPISSLWHKGGLLAVQDNNNHVLLFDPNAPGVFVPRGQGSPGGCLGFDLTRADGDLTRGLWIPLGAYGIVVIGEDN
jgi:hypothetical protein